MQSTEQILASTPGSSQLPTSSQTPSRVLVVEPHPTLRTVLVQRLRQDGHLAAAVGSAAEAVDLCREQSPDLLVSAEILEQNTAMRLAQQLGAAVIVLTARSGVEALVNLLDEGGEYSINDITSLFDNSVSEPIFFILREMCFGNDNYLVKGDWSNPNSLVIQKIKS